MLSGKNVLLAVTGSIAAYKSAFLVREFIKSGAFVKEETNWEFNKWKPLKFKFKIEGVGEDLYIKFGKGGHFNGLILDISKSDIAWSNHFLKGTNTSGTFILNHERFKYVFVDGGTAAMMTGTCDKF